jgi:hypothetical protein
MFIEPTQDDIDAIVDEVFDMLDAIDLFAHLRGDVKTQELDMRLQEILNTCENRSTTELAVWLRASYVGKNKLLTWWPLLEASAALATARGEETSDIFYGLL